MFKENLIVRARSFINNRIRGVGRAKYHSVFDENRFIFIHIPKTAGISVLESLLGEGIRVGHSKALEYKRLDIKKFDEYYKFAFVRNPWDRFLSSYLFLKKGGITEPDRRWSEKNLKEIDSFQEFVTKINEDVAFKKEVMKWKHFLPQHKYICDSEYQIIVDHIGKFESLEMEYDILRKKVGFGKELRKLNVSRDKRHSYKEYYLDEQMIDLVKTLYNVDIQTLGYDF